MVNLIDELQASVAERYRIEAEIGHGGGARVYRATDLPRQRTVAIKVMRAELALEPDRFLREILILARLQHPNVMPLFDSGLAGDLPYYVMPFIQGNTLRDRLRAGRIELPEALAIALEAADALSYAHAQGLVHRDVKPENILLEDGHAVVADFGIARAIEEATDTVTGSGIAIGTPAYMSPEQRAGNRMLDGRCDQYSLACVIYEMLCGSLPSTADPAAPRSASASDNAIERLRKLRPEVPELLAAAVSRALSQDPEQRFDTIAAFADALAGGVTGHSLSRSHRVRAMLRAGERRRRGTPIWFAAAALMSIALAGITFVVSQVATSRRAPPVADADPRRIAVLYFDDLSPDRSLGYLASGLTEGLIHELSGVGAIQVISRNGVKPFRDAAPPIDSVARALHVGSIVEGSVQRSNNRVRVTVQLTDARSKAQVTSATFEREMGELFRLEDDLAQHVAELLRRRIGAQIRLRERETATRSDAARELAYRADGLRDKAASLAATQDTSDLADARATLAAADSLLSAAEAADHAWIDPTVERGWVALESGLYSSGAPQARAFNAAITRASDVLHGHALNASALELRGTARYLAATRLPQRDADVHSLLGQALNDLQAAVSADTTRAAAWGAMSRVRTALGDVVGAERDAHTALEMDAYLTDRPDIFLRLYAAE